MTLSTLEPYTLHDTAPLPSPQVLCPKEIQISGAVGSITSLGRAGSRVAETPVGEGVVTTSQPVLTDRDT